MLVDDYFQRIRETIAECPAVHSSSITFDQRTIHMGYIRGLIVLIDGSILHVREFVDVEVSLERYTYAYHYQRDNDLIFRYDNTEHHRNLNLATFPHHKHDGDETNIVAASAPTLADVLDEIENLIYLADYPIETN